MSNRTLLLPSLYFLPGPFLPKLGSTQNGVFFSLTSIFLPLQMLSSPEVAFQIVSAYPYPTFLQSIEYPSYFSECVCVHLHIAIVAKLYNKLCTLVKFHCRA